ncbi:MAG: hypothetical protein DRJ26_01635 [Candidatus Methanomethylicota archaeon]|uniref:Helicase HerA central domain-containing protein n=1 Tax=Thermoproteota archaeon TaxID=2056631 RepID=A0A497F602_9CREN|nr:MAG: hypothetical protein DRJ26_01635 [Candidatus Verstraetearchaeota archaeon]
MGEVDRVGVVIWAESNLIQFRVYTGKRVERGQLLKVIDKGLKFIVRVFDFKPEALLSPAEVARISFKREKGEEVELIDRPLRCYDIAIATIIAQIDELGVVSGPTTVPSLFSYVEYLTDEDTEQLSLDTGDIEIGFLRSGHKATTRKVTLNGARAFPHHILVCSITGGGKTNFGKVLAWNVMRSGGLYSLLVIDTESEYFDGGDAYHLGLVHSSYAEKSLFYVTPKVKFPCNMYYEFKLSGELISRRIQAHPLEIWWGDLRPSDFEQTGEFTPPQESLLWMAWNAYDEEWLKYLIYKDANYIYNDLRGKSQKVTILVTKRKLRRILSNDEIFKREKCNTNLINAVLQAISEGKVVLIDMPSASESQEKLITVLFAKRIFKLYEKLRKIAPKKWEQLPTTLIMVEEAHRYLSKRALYSDGARRENIFSIISKRGRKYRVGICCITQMPGELDEPIVRQQLTKVILPLPTKPDYQLIINYSPYLENAGQEIKTLDKGEALVLSPPSGFKFAVPVKIHSFESIIIEELTRELKMRQLVPV